MGQNKVSCPCAPRQNTYQARIVADPNRYQNTNIGVAHVCQMSKKENRKKSIKHWSSDVARPAGMHELKSATAHHLLLILRMANYCRRVFSAAQKRIRLVRYLEQLLTTGTPTVKLLGKLKSKRK